MSLVGIPVLRYNMIQNWKKARTNIMESKIIFKYYRRVNKYQVYAYSYYGSVMMITLSKTVAFDHKIVTTITLIDDYRTKKWHKSN